MKKQPKRIKRNGFFAKLPDNTKLVARPTRWANPFPVSEHGREKALKLYREYLEDKIQKGELNPAELKGYDLACYCAPGEECHADILLELANR
jgi:hypothetical protein